MTTKHARSKIEIGLIIAAHGRHYAVQLLDGSLLHCFPRGKRDIYACGDIVHVERSGEQQGMIREAQTRTSLLYRSDRRRQKIIAANITQAAIVVAARPAFNEKLLMRCLIACEQQAVAGIIVLNKIDLVEETAKTAKRLAHYEDLGYRLVSLSAKSDVSSLRAALQGHRSVLVGQSGMGKSTIVNSLVPGSKARTAEVSKALNSGRHTTTSAHLYHLDEETTIIDSPGLQTFGLLHMSPAELLACFGEFSPFIGLCRFDNCRHTVEPGCAVIAAVKEMKIGECRWLAYRDLLSELDAKPPSWS